MKNKTLVYFLAVAILLPSTVSAQSLLDRYAPGTSYNPIEVQIVQDPYEAQQQQNILFESQLKAQYGYSLYSSCTPSSCITADTYRDPYARSSCLRAIESCAQSYQMRNDYAAQWESDCKNSYGQYAKLASVNEQAKKYTCGCISGYEFNSSGTSCVPIKTQDQLCAEKYQGSRLIGGYCDCPSGYQWNSGQTQCVQKEAVVPITTPDFDLQCRNSSGDGSRWSGKVMDSGLSKNGWPICECKEGYKWNSTATTCVQIQASSSGGGGGGGGYSSPAPTILSTFTYDKNLSKGTKEREMITNASATLRGCPARTCEQKGVYPSGTTFLVRQQYGDSDLWYRGATPDGNEGWIYSVLLNEVAKDQAEDVVVGTNASTSPVEVIATSSKQEPTTPKQSTWKKIIRWFTFWR